MQDKYKETSRGGLAVNVIECALITRGTTRCSRPRGRSPLPWLAGNTFVLKPSELTPHTRSS
jgi:hypothetical protein